MANGRTFDGVGSGHREPKNHAHDGGLERITYISHRGRRRRRTPRRRSGTIAAYKRIDYFEQRRPMMIGWAKFTGSTPVTSPRHVTPVVTNEIVPTTMVG
jgi:hypothetical protein